MADGHAKPSCLVHFKEVSGFLTTFTDISFEKFLKCHELWLGLDGERREIAEKTKHIVKDIQHNRGSIEHKMYTATHDISFIRYLWRTYSK